MLCRFRYCSICLWHYFFLWFVLSAVWHKRDSPVPPAVSSHRQLPVLSGNTYFQPIFTAGSVLEGWSCCCQLEVREVSFWLSSDKQDERCSSGDGWKKVLVFFLWFELFNESVLSSEAEGPGLRSDCVTSVLVRREPPCTEHDWLSLLRCSGSLSKSCFLGLFSLLQPWYRIWGWGHQPVFGKRWDCFPYSVLSIWYIQSFSEEKMTGVVSQEIAVTVESYHNVSV